MDCTECTNWDNESYDICTDKCLTLKRWRLQYGQYRSYKGVLMSYQYKRNDIRVIVCDVCGDFSSPGDHRWQPTAQSTVERPIHICPACRRVALWCPAHQQYHLPNSFHRHACADCGGLFTSVVRDALTRCPACRRAAAEIPRPSAPPRNERPRSWVQSLFAPRNGQRG